MALTVVLCASESYGASGKGAGIAKSWRQRVSWGRLWRFEHELSEMTSGTQYNAAVISFAVVRPVFAPDGVPRATDGRSVIAIKTLCSTVGHSCVADEVMSAADGHNSPQDETFFGASETLFGTDAIISFGRLDVDP